MSETCFAKKTWKSFQLHTLLQRLNLDPYCRKLKEAKKITLAEREKRSEGDWEGKRARLLQ